jgi:hypothetical protein
MLIGVNPTCQAPFGPPMMFTFSILSLDSIKTLQMRLSELEREMKPYREIFFLRVSECFAVLLNCASKHQQRLRGEKARTILTNSSTRLSWTAIGSFASDSVFVSTNIFHWS